MRSRTGTMVWIALSVNLWPSREKPFRNGRLDENNFIWGWKYKLPRITRGWVFVSIAFGSKYAPESLFFCLDCHENKSDSYLPISPLPKPTSHVDCLWFDSRFVSSSSKIHKLFRFELCLIFKALFGGGSERRVESVWLRGRLALLFMKCARRLNFNPNPRDIETKKAIDVQVQSKLAFMVESIFVIN